MKEIRIKTPAGTMVVEDLKDPDYPGIRIGLANDKDDFPILMAHVEYDEDKGFRAILFRDEEMDEPTEILPFLFTKNRR